MTAALSEDVLPADIVEARVVPTISQAQVFILTKDRQRWFVRKVARNPGASGRLRAQACKQAAFAACIGDIIKTPRIVDEGEVDGRYYFDMDFVRGPDGASFLRSAPFTEVARFADRLCEYLELAARSAAIGPATKTTSFEALFARICQIQQRTGALSDHVAARLLLALDRLRTDGPAVPSLCHGDLTLENIIVDDGTIWVVDLLDPPFEHWWNDVAKLHQDLSGGWFLRRKPAVAFSVTQYVSARLLDCAVARSPAYAALHAVLVACNFVRILPYVETAEERQFVLDRIAHFVAEL